MKRGGHAKDRMLRNCKELEAERLALVPLTVKQLDLWLENVKALEDEMNCGYRGEPVQGHFVDFIRARYAKAQSDAGNYLYHTVWFSCAKPTES